MNVTIIANPIAGGGKGRILATRLHELLGNGVAHAELFLTQKAGDATDRAAADTSDCIAVVGGDGTLNEVVNGAGEGENRTIAILPVGTANVVARELNMPRRPEETARLIQQQHTRWMDAGAHEGRRFLLGAGAGLDAAVVNKVSATRGKKSNLSRWIRPSIQTVFSYSFPPIKVMVDGNTVSENAQYAILGNCRYSAGVFPVTPRAVIDDGLLDVCLLHRLSVARLAGLAARVWNPRFIEARDVIYVQGRNIEFLPGGEEQPPLQVDGDPAGAIPASFEVRPRAFQMVVP